MGQKLLEEKLGRELVSAEELTEARVVYMLVCVRKLMEISGPKLQGLIFHCDWALHSRLDRKAAIGVIKLFDNLEEAITRGDEMEIMRAQHALNPSGYNERLTTCQAGE